MSKDFLDEGPDPQKEAEGKALAKVQESQSLAQLPEPIRREITTMVAEAVGQALNPLLSVLKQNGVLTQRMLKQQQAVTGGPMFDEDWDEQQSLAEELDPTLRGRIEQGVKDKTQKG